jgi:hypothetical protein
VFVLPLWRDRSHHAESFNFFSARCDHREHGAASIFFSGRIEARASMMLRFIAPLFRAEYFIPDFSFLSGLPPTGGGRSDRRGCQGVRDRPLEFPLRVQRDKGEGGNAARLRPHVAIMLVTDSATVPLGIPLRHEGRSGASMERVPMRCASG